MCKILEMTKVTAGYGDHIVLRDVNLVVYENDFLGIIGPNGSGKSTLLKLILGLLKPWRGKIEFYHTSPQAIGYLPQLKDFDRQFPIAVIDVVLSGLLSRVPPGRRFGTADRRKAEQLLDQMGIAALQQRAIGELSGGQMQRVFLARALIADPCLLLLDEPNTFIDTQFESDFYHTLTSLNEHMAIVLVSHDIGVVGSHVKNIACVNKTVYYHASNQMTEDVLAHYGCPVDIITHGELPHRVLKKH